MSHQYTTSVYTRSQTKPSKPITHEMSLTSGDLTKILEAVGTKQIDQFLTLQKETETFHKTQMDDLKAVNQQQLTDMQNFFKEQPQVSAAIPKKGISEPPSFSGTQNEDFSSWLKKFQAVAKMNQWSDETCAPLLHTCLKDPALTYFQSLDLDVQNNFQAAVQALEQRFNDANIQASLRLDLHSRKQGPIESVFDYSNALEKSFLRLNITDEYYKLLLFLDGLQPHLQLDVNKQGPTTYLRAKEIARNLERELRQQARKHAATVSTLQSDQKLDDTLSRLTKKIDALENSVSNLHRKQNRFSNFRPGQHPRRFQSRTSQGVPICSNCNKVGHVARTCFSNFPRQNFSRPNFRPHPQNSGSSGNDRRPLPQGRR